MKQIDFKFYTDLKSQSISPNQAPKSIVNSSIYKNLFESGILGFEKSGRGRKIIINKPDLYEEFLRNSFPSIEELSASKSNNIKQLRNSKAKRTQSETLFFIRGFHSVMINGQTVNISHYTKTFGLFGTVQPTLSANKICFVENKDTFIKAERLLGEEWLYIHSYGRIGKDSIRNIKANEVLVFVDYDFNGLDEYLRIKEVLSNANLYLPENFQLLFNTYSTKFKGEQKASVRVESSELKVVVMIRDLIQKSNRFLEQEILISD